MRKIIYILAILILFFGLALTGCTEDNGVEDNGEEHNGEEDNGVPDNGDDENGLTGTNDYSGDWSGSIGTDDYEGTWEFQVDFDEGTVSGWFEGDGSGDITGTVSDGVIQAEGEAGFGHVEWSGTFSSDGNDISGTWEVNEHGYQIGSGTWSGSLDS